jgi:hypothetical protein
MFKCFKCHGDADQPNTKFNHANDSLEVQNRPIIRVRAKKLKKALNGLVQNIWRKMDLEELGTSKEHEEQPSEIFVSWYFRKNSLVSNFFFLSLRHIKKKNC